MAITLHGFCPFCHRPMLLTNDGRGNVGMVFEDGMPNAGEPHDYDECKTATAAKSKKL